MSKKQSKKAKPKEGATIAEIQGGLPEAVARFIEENTAKAPREDLCVFAFRLTREERDAIHRAAGKARASKFVRTLAVAAALNDKEAIKEILSAVHATT